MHRDFRVLAVAAVAAAAMLPDRVSAQKPDQTKAGTLTCDISAGIDLIVKSRKNLTCMLTPAQPGPREVYIGAIGKFGPDAPTATDGEMIWSVYAPNNTSNKRFGALAGHYGSASAPAKVGGGIGPTALVGGLDRAIALQPLSLPDDPGVNVAAGVSEFELRPAR
jgi:Protein of unknown function (DUF992)